MTGNAFWRYSLERYSRNGVPELCLSLQDEYGADVNVVLFALWLGQTGHLFGPNDPATCAAAVRNWHHSVVVPMRGVRRWLKTADIADAPARDALRAAVKTSEIRAENMEQNMLFALTQDGSLAPVAESGPPERCMASNLQQVCSAPSALVDRLIELCR